MASASFHLSEEQLLCSICLDVFNHPVTLPCGHNFCKACLRQHFDSNDQWTCPVCNRQFSSRPKLQVNTVLSEMASEFRNQQHDEPIKVPCDICTETKNEAVKTCLTCMTSYCKTHLEPHQRVPRLKKHQLIDPVENLEDRMCQKHNKPLELFCQTDQVCVCQICCWSDHKPHQGVPLKEECEGKKAQLGQTEAEVQQKIQERRLKIQQIQNSVKLSKDDADRQIAEGVKITALIRSIEKSQAELISTIQDKHKSTERQAEGFIKEMKKEIMELTKRSSQLEKLSHTEDHLHLLQTLPSMINLPHTKDWTKVNVHQPSYVGTVWRDLDQLEKTLYIEIMKICEAELKKIQQEAVDVTLDPETAHPQLVLSEDGKQVYDRHVKKNLPDNPVRCSNYACVLAKESFSSGRFYYEVGVKGKNSWWLGVVRRSVNRKVKLTWNPSNGYWVLSLSGGGQYTACIDPVVNLSVREKFQKVGVLVDYEEGMVSFYDVENKVHIYSFTGCSFTEPLYPIFHTGKKGDSTNSSPLIITPVNNAVFPWQLEKTLNVEMKEILEDKLKKIQQEAVDVTLDPETAHPLLVLSGDGKQVYNGGVKNNLPDNPKRCSYYVSVLGKESFSLGRFYYEVEVKGKTEWKLGVVRRSINRKGLIPMRPSNGYWVIRLYDGNQFRAYAGPAVRLSVKEKLQKVGVLVDYEEGLVSFYDVENKVLIYSFTGCSFTEPLYPVFDPGNVDDGKNSSPLIITPVTISH